MVARSSHPRISLIIVGVGMTLLSALVSFVVSQPVAAGSAPAVLDCKSVSRMEGAVSISGHLPGDYEVLDLKIKKGNAEQLLKSFGTLDRDMDPAEITKLEEDGVVAKDWVLTVVEDFNRGVFSVALRRSDDRYQLRLYALPRTVRARINSNSTKASFEAMLLEANIPGDSRNYPDRKAIRMRCTYDHSI